MVRIIVNRDKCTNCGICTDSCVQGILVMIDDKMTVDTQHQDDCVGCLQCELDCPNDALRIWNKKPVMVPTNAH